MFGKHLVDRGLLTEAQLLDALEKQSSTRASVGRIAFEMGFLDLDQVLAVITAQESGGGNLRFCAQAVALGHLSDDQRLELLAAQEESRIPLGQTLVAMSLLPADIVAEELDDYDDRIASAVS